MRIRLLGAFVVGLALCSCNAASRIAYEPLVGADSIAVTLQSSAGVPLSGLPRLQIIGLTNDVSVVWEVESGPCEIAQASAARAGNVIEIRLQRGGNPAANCVPARVGYRYAARVAGLAQGRYEVRLTDASFSSEPPHEVGRDFAIVGPLYVMMY